jgi:hypothetical protein
MRRGGEGLYGPVEAQAHVGVLAEEHDGELQRLLLCAGFRVSVRWCVPRQGLAATVTRQTRRDPTFLHVFSLLQNAYPVARMAQIKPMHYTVLRDDVPDAHGHSDPGSEQHAALSCWARYAR